jgi:S1/P1 Nuclease
LRKAIAVLLMVAFVPMQLLGWGGKGHRIIADIAYSRLTPQTRNNVQLLLGRESLASISTWVDDIRQQRNETYGWHFVDIPGTADAFSEERDCFRPWAKHGGARTDHHNCAVDRVEMFSRVLADPKAPRQQRVEALKWVVHLVGDLHQPLHATSDAHGGNDIKLPVFGNPQCGEHQCSLHGVWDSELLEHAGLSEPEYVQELQELIDAEQLDRYAEGSPADWANESHGQAKSIMSHRPALVDQAYFAANIHLLDEKLALAGLRLAALLNRTLGSIPTAQLRRELQEDH